MPLTRFELLLGDSAATDVLGAALARVCAHDPHGGVVYMQGEVGAGKTTCVRSLLRSLGVEGLIRSPTYTLVEVYELTSLTCVHVDLYRLQGPIDVEDLGLREYARERCLLLVEWPEKGAGALAAADLDLSFSYDPPGRRCRLSALTPHGLAWLGKLARDDSLTPYVFHLT